MSDQEAIAKVKAELEIMRELYESSQRNELRMLGATEAHTDCIERMEQTLAGLVDKVKAIHAAKPTALDKLLAWTQTWPGKVSIGALALATLTAWGVDLGAVVSIIKAGILGG